MKLMELYDNDTNKKIYVDPSKIYIVADDVEGKGTNIYLGEYMWTVKESPEEIARKYEEIMFDKKSTYIPC